MEFENDVNELAKNIDLQIEKEEALGIDIESMTEHEKLKRRKNYADEFIVGMSKFEKKK